LACILPINKPGNVSLDSRGTPRAHRQLTLAQSRGQKQRKGQKAALGSVANAGYSPHANTSLATITDTANARQSSTPWQQAINTVPVGGRLCTTPCLRLPRKAALAAGCVARRRQCLKHAANSGAAGSSYAARETLPRGGIRVWPAAFYGRAYAAPTFSTRASLPFHDAISNLAVRILYRSIAWRRHRGHAHASRQPNASGCSHQRRVRLECAN